MMFVQLFGENFCYNFLFLIFYWSKIIERKKRKRESKHIMWVWKIDVEVSHDTQSTLIGFGFVSLYWYKYILWI